jgi:D-threonate/D-erythronate kinase
MSSDVSLVVAGKNPYPSGVTRSMQSRDDDGTRIQRPGERPLSLIVMADDLTGALDSAARFVPLVGPVPTVWCTTNLPEVAALDCGTRDADAATAAATMARLAPVLHDAGIAFKKIDSLLRGHVRLELAACLPGFDRCILAPAFPFQGRITRNRRQLMRTADGWRDTGVDLTGIDPRVQVCDAVTDADLLAIVAAGHVMPGRTLWCGTAGLAGGLAGFRPVPRPALPRPILALIGSDHPVSAAQLAAAAPHHVRLPVGDHDIVRGLLANGAAAVSLALSPATDREQERLAIAAAFDGLLSQLDRPGTLFVTGGETLRGLCNALGASGLEVDGEIEPGMPTSRLRGGIWDGQRIVSKSGAFGDVTCLARLLASADRTC